MEIRRGSHVPHEWLWFDIFAVIILATIIIVDLFFVPYKKNHELNIYCYLGISTVALLGLIYGYFYEIDYLIDH